MERCQKAIHLRTGDRGTDGAISAWLERHGVEVVTCADAFEACTFTLTHSATVPELALVGADWLAPDELAILSYLRETWPGVTIVIYGSAPATAGFEASALTHVCRSAFAVRRMLAAVPGAMVEESLRALRAQPSLDDGWRPQPETPRAEEHSAAGEMPAPRQALRTRDAAAMDADIAPHVNKQHRELAAGQRPPASQTILTKEELAALLDDDEN